MQVESVTTVPPNGTLKDANGSTVDNIGYVHIREFSRRTAEELAAAVKDQLAKGGNKGLIIDVRSDPGGLLNTVIKVADEFLDKGNIAHPARRQRQGNSLRGPTRQRSCAGGYAHRPDPEPL